MCTYEKPIKGSGIYNKKVCWSPLDDLVHFVDTGFDIRNNYNLMMTVKIKNENVSESTPNISYKIGKL